MSVIKGSMTTPVNCFPVSIHGPRFAAGLPLKCRQCALTVPSAAELREHTAEHAKVRKMLQLRQRRKRVAAAASRGAIR